MRKAPARFSRRRFYQILEGDDSRDWIGRLVHYLLITLICLSVFFTIVETDRHFRHEWRAPLEIGALFVVVVFAVEYGLRIWVAVDDPRRKHMSPLKARIDYILSFAGIVDLIAITPFVLVQILDMDLRAFAFLRLLRFLKLLRYSTGIMALAEAIVGERQTLLACLVVLMSVVTVSATVMYELEATAQPEYFGSIPLAMWWAMETVTTVGYGDAIPTTASGRIIGGITMIMGLIVLALPVAVVATSFSEVIRRRGFVVNWATLARIPLFADLEPATLAEILSVIRAQTYDAGNLVLRIGDEATSLYVIATGDLEVSEDDNVTRLSDGDAFGGPLRFGGESTPCVVRAMTRTRMLVVPHRELTSLMGRHPAFSARVRRMEAEAPPAASAPPV